MIRILEYDAKDYNIKRIEKDTHSYDKKNILVKSSITSISTSQVNDKYLILINFEFRLTLFSKILLCFAVLMPLFLMIIEKN